MKSDATLAIVVVLVGVGAWLLFSQRRTGGATVPRSLVDIIGTLPPDPRFLPKQDRLTAGRGAVTGLQQGVAIGTAVAPGIGTAFGAGIGAAGGAIASLFID
jgi:hypothetical protein